MNMNPNVDFPIAPTNGVTSEHELYKISTKNSIDVDDEKISENKLNHKSKFYPEKNETEGSNLDTSLKTDITGPTYDITTFKKNAEQKMVQPFVYNNFVICNSDSELSALPFEHAVKSKFKTSNYIGEHENQNDLESDLTPIEKKKKLIIQKAKEKQTEEEIMKLTRIKPDHISPDDDCPEFNTSYNFPIPNYDNKEKLKTEYGNAILKIERDKIFEDYNIIEEIDDMLSDFENNPNIMGFFACYTTDQLVEFINKAVAEKEKVFYFLENLY